MTAQPAAPLTLYRFPLSGHSHRAELLLSLLGLPVRLVDVDLRKGAHKQPDFLKLNPFGQVPVLDDNGTVITDMAGYTSIAHAPEGNVSLTDYPHVRAWLARIEALPGFVPMQPTRAGLAA